MDKEQLDRARKAFDDVYGDIVKLPEGAEKDQFYGQLLGHLFGEVWSRDALSVRDRRLITFGAVAALAEYGAFEIHMRSALTKGEVSVTDAREILAFLVCYTGYARGLGLDKAVNDAIAAYELDTKQGKK